MLEAKLLFISVLAYASGQGVSYYGSSSVRTQSRLPPRPISYRPGYVGQSPVYNPQPVYQAPTAQLPEQSVPRPQAPLQSHPPLRPLQLTYGIIPQPPVYDPEADTSTPEPTTEAPEIPPQTIYSPIPPHSAIPLQPSSRPISPRPLPAWSWRPSTPAVVIIEENPTTPAQIIYPSSTSNSVEPSVESSSQLLVIEEHTSEPEEKAMITSSVSESSSIIEYHERSEPSTQKLLPELIKVPQTSSPYSDYRIDSQEPLIDPIPEPSSEQPQPVVESVYVTSPQPPSNIQAEISPYQSYSYPSPRPLPERPSTSPVPVIALEPQPIEPEPKSINPVPSSSSYSDYRITSQGPLIDPIPEPSSEQPQPAVESVYISSPQPPSNIQAEISPYQSYSYPAPRPLPERPSISPVPVIAQPIEPEPKSINPVPSVPSYRPIELQEPQVSVPIQTTSRPNYQLSTPSSSPQPLPVQQFSAPAVRPNYYQPPVPAPEPVRIPLSYQPIAPTPVLQSQPPPAPRPSYQPKPSQRPAYQPAVIQPPQLVAKPIQHQISQQPLPVVQPAPIPVPISQPSYQSGPVPVPEALPIIPIDDFHCNAGNAYYQVVNECDSYIACQGQRAWKHTCPDGLHFNPKALYPAYPCAYPSEVKCEVAALKQSAQPTSECPNQYGFFPLPGGDCSKYLMCQDGKASVMNCPFGLVFNNQLSSCDWPENVPQCSLSAFKDFSCPIPPEDDPDFLTRHRYGNDCGMYVACQRGHPRLLKCDLGLSFDEDSQVCIDTDLVEKCSQKEARYY